MGQYGGEGDDGMEGEDGAQYVQVTEEEQAAIGRLEAMGFERNMVLQVRLFSFLRRLIQILI